MRRPNLRWGPLRRHVPIAELTVLLVKGAGTPAANGTCRAYRMQRWKTKLRAGHEL